MKTRVVAVLSVIANLVLAVGLAYLFFSAEPSDASNQAKWMPPSVTNIIIDTQGLDATNALAGIISGVSPFHWSRIESDDYQRYIANLRSIGCPETTIRDIIAADINLLFAPRYQEAVAKMQGFDYWRTGGADRGKEQALRSEFAAIDGERDSLLLELLGTAGSADINWSGLNHDERLATFSYVFLAPEKQFEVRSIIESFEALTAQVRAELDGLSADEQRLKRQELRQQRRDALAEVLSDDELLELELRDSSAADSLRSKIAHFDLTEEEYGSMFLLRQGYEDEQGAEPDYGNPEAMDDRNLARETLEADYAAVLGEERYTEFVRSQDRSWRTLSNVAETHGLKDDSLEQAYALKQRWDDDIANLMLEADIEHEDRGLLMSEIQKQYHEDIAAVLGDQAFESYQSAGISQTIRLTAPSGGAAGGAAIFGFSNEFISDAPAELRLNVIRTSAEGDVGDVIVGGSGFPPLPPTQEQRQALEVIQEVIQ